MVLTVKRCLQLALKVANAAIGILGIAMIIYGVWMLRVWQHDTENSSSDDDHDSTLPWFIHAFLGIGIALCAITFLGHVAADTANTCCLGCYSVIIFLLIVLNSAMIADVLLNSEWEKGCCILLATVIRTLETDERDNNISDDEEHGEPRIPFLNQPAAQDISTYVVGEPYRFYNDEEWKVTK